MHPKVERLATRVRVLLPATLLVALLACEGTDPGAGPPCPDAEGEFPPTDCAYVEGRLLAGDSPLVGRALRVDVVVGQVGYAYASDAVATDVTGHFRLLVYRVNRFEPVTPPDTATVYVKIYPDLGAAQPGTVTSDSVPVRMVFAPMGAVVDTTRVELRLGP